MKTQRLLVALAVINLKLLRPRAPSGENRLALRWRSAAVFAPCAIRYQ